MAVEDWAEGMLALDIVDSLICPLIYHGLDETALLTGGGAFSLVAQHFTAWFADQRKWIDALRKVWVADSETGAANVAVLSEIIGRWHPQALDAVRPLASFIDTQLPEAGAVAALAELDATETTTWTELLGDKA